MLYDMIKLTRDYGRQGNLKKVDLIDYLFKTMFLDTDLVL